MKFAELVGPVGLHLVIVEVWWCM